MQSHRLLKNRPAFLFCLFACLSFLLVEPRAQPIYRGVVQPIDPHSLAPGDYWGGTARNYRIHAVVGTNGSISMLLRDRSPQSITVGGILGVGTNLASGLVHVSFGEAGYLEGRAKPLHRKIVGRLVLRAGDKMKA